MLQHHHLTPTPPRRVVVLGASGFIGRRLLQHLAELGTETVPVASKDIDLCQPESIAQLQALVQAEDTLVFASALTPDRGRDRRTMLKNIAMGDYVSQFLENASCAHLIYLSSDAVYQEGEYLIRENSCCQPASLYGLGHLVREEILREVANRVSIPLAILRPCAIYGAGDPHNSYGPNRFRRMALEQRQITLFGQGEEKRDHVYVEDVVALVGLVVGYKSAGVLNLATGVSMSFMEVAQKIARLYGSEVEIKCLPRANPVTHVHFDITAIHKAFPSFQFTLLDRGLAETFKKAAEK
jgi:nucleoside-diphosphate-sugar epimerase